MVEHAVFVSFVDVAQGDSITAVCARTGEAIVVDCPTHAAEFTAGALRASGATVVSTLLLTHLHADHIGDALDLVERVPVRRIRTNVASDPRASAQVVATLRALADLADNDVEVLPATSEQPSDSAGEVMCRVLYPTHARTLDAATRANANHGSVVCRLVAYGWTWLLTSDATGEAFERLLLNPEALDADVAQLPHHGGLLATRDDPVVLRRLLDAVRPRDIVVSVGLNNGHGHPRGEHLRLAASRGRLMCTQINKVCLGDRDLPMAQAAGLPGAAYAAGAVRTRGCSCSGTIVYAARPDALEVSPTPDEHAAVVDLLDAPQCR
jgi:competence protein ComEC